MNGIYAFPERSIDLDAVLHGQEVFEELLHRETARSLRSGRPFLLALIDVSVNGPGGKPMMMARQIASVLFSSTREIDQKGWYAEDAVIGILFTEFGSMHDSVDTAREVIVARLQGSLTEMFGDGNMPRVMVAPMGQTESNRYLAERGAISLCWQSMYAQDITRVNGLLKNSVTGFSGALGPQDYKINPVILNASEMRELPN